MFHRLKIDENTELPAKFNNPFCYTPHPLCLAAADEVRNYIATRTDWYDELSQGKMFGVLVCENASGEIGYLAAFSGNLAHSNNHPFFVPPVYDLLNPQGFFKLEESNISSINHRISELQNSADYQNIVNELRAKETEGRQKIDAFRQQMKADKARRDEIRKSATDKETIDSLIKESQFQKAELKRRERDLKQELDRLKEKADAFKNEIEQLKQERKQRSFKLQMQLFDEFRLLNAKGEARGICALFAESPSHPDIPPAGTGECAAPKLLQYAYANGFRPVAMAEFWWGESPKGEIRRHGNFYPACQGKCAPLLRHMLIGLDVEDNQRVAEASRNHQPKVIYEDEWLLVVDKPSGMLSVPGKVSEVSVYQWAAEHYPEATGPLVVHRLDMATSGLLVIAKNKDVCAMMQRMFEQREVRKKYVALLESRGNLAVNESGRIELPLAPDYINRPRQKVDFVNGKTAVTTYNVLSRTDDYIRIELFPHTGRTHQLRVHCASIQGLNAPIIGDELYGTRASRLFLHAEQITFVHPVTKKSLTLESKTPF
ncbi:MAG: RNA pseudouridine synthase [Bacteroidaceae bacterium]|nr:RNA pseudouridine synthase [Bacteroidaceae bacterium]